MAVFLTVTAIVALTPVLGGYPPDPFTEHLKTVSPMYSGVIGIAIGHYPDRRSASPHQR